MGKVERIRERDQRLVEPADGTKPLPELHARWERKKDWRIQERMDEGYRAAKPEDFVEMPKKAILKGNEIHRKDLILMVAPREIVEKRYKERLESMENDHRRTSEKLDEAAGAEDFGSSSKIYSIPSKDSISDS